MTKHVALVCRLSPRPDGSYEGVDAQEKWGREYATKTWPGVPVEVFPDRGISAADDESKRPEYDRFRQWVRAGRVAHVWAVEQSRLERREVPWFELAAELDRAGIGAIHTNRNGVIEVRGVLAGIQAVLNANYVRELKRRVNDKLEWLAGEGRPPGGRGFGYIHVVDDQGRKALKIVPGQAGFLRWASERALAGWSLSSLCKEAHTRGLTGAHGGKITTTTMRSMLTSPTIAGLRVYRGEIVGRGNWEPIIDERTFFAVRAKLAAPRKVNGGVVPASMFGTRPARKYLLTAFVFCGLCKTPLTAASKTWNYAAGKVRRPYLQCHTNRGGCGRIGIGYEDTEAYVLGRLWAELDKTEFLDAIGADDYAVRRDELLNALDDVERQRKALAQEWSNPGALTMDEWRTAREGLAAQEAQINEHLRELPPPSMDIDIAAVREAWDDAMPLDEQRELLGLFIQRVVVKSAMPGRKGFDSDRVDIEWRTL